MNNIYCERKCPYFWNDGFKFYCKKYDNHKLVSENMTDKEIDDNIGNTYNQDFNWYRLRTYRLNSCIDDFGNL